MYENTNFLAGMGGGDAGISGFMGYSGAVGYDQISELVKSLTAGADTSIAEAASSGNTTGFALRPQSLERTLTITTYGDRHIVLWKQIPKEGAKSTVEEYNTLTSYGDEWLSAFSPEGELPGGEDSVYERNLMRVKFMGSLRSVTDPFGMVANANGDPIANETTNGLRWLNRQIERSLYFADSDIVPTEFDGFKKMMEMGGAEIIDARSSSEASVGGVMSKDLIDDIADKINNKYFGDISELHYGTTAHKLFGRAIGTDPHSGDSISRLDVKGINGGDVIPGFRMGVIATLFGDVRLRPNLFLNQPGMTESQMTSARFAKGWKPPAAPSLDSDAASSSDGAGKWGTVASKIYKYAIVAMCPRGNSIATLSSEVTLDSAVKKISLGFSSGSGGQSAPTGFIVLRTAPYVSGAYSSSTTPFYEIGRIKAQGTGGTTTVTFIDRNDVIAGTGYAFAMTTGDNTYAWKQLAPAMKIPLAKIDLTTRWAQVVYGAPILRAPKKWILVKNLAQN